MVLNDVIDIKKPDPDSHFRLRPCEKCCGDNVAYVLQKNDSGEAWHAECFDCGHVGAEDTTRHGAQIRWNGTMMEGVT